MAKTKLRRGQRGWYKKVYLASDHWKNLKKRYRVERNWVCAECFQEHGLELHHLHYKSLFNESLDDLIPLCREHHHLYHCHEITTGEQVRERRKKQERARRPSRMKSYKVKEWVPLKLQREGVEESRI